MAEDARGRLDDDLFDYQLTKSGQVLVSRGGRRIAVIAGAKAAKLVAQLDRGDERARQLALAKVTGNYRHGNERR